ncbi:biopolymer transporter ExbD [Pararhizobium mangrovi]|uniref:Biopolymer transporter ExbD n=1 Tax=Pararhizobium mangrovi TaxID=2590452 RepID=A0A506U958_9HYPH|nr:biopolymer transporter ExbD [Pararhizobium mangrovi]TPW29896.1 biopolymer transporter ExbD [Pararhizobium mangrovi]
MRIERSARRTRRPSLTSLIDIIFLLLLFFMLSSTFTRFASVDIAGGRAGSGGGTAPRIIARLGAEDWSVNGQQFADADAAIDEMNRLSRVGGKAAVLLVGGGVDSQRLVTAVEAVRARTDLDLSIAGRAGEETRR